MIGATYVFSDLSGISVPAMPDAVSNVTTLALVNQDGFSSEYRLRGVAHDYSLKIRNTSESPDKSGVKRTRHNAEFTITTRSTVTDGVVTPAVPYVVSITMRMPEQGLSALMITMLQHLCYDVAIGTGTIPAKMLNFES